MQSIKEHNLKANHNSNKYGNWMPKSVCNLSKNTIWKQITTQVVWAKDATGLYAIYQRTQSESKSQPGQTTPTMSAICMQSIKEHNLKANHNSKLMTFFFGESVCNLSKNTIWKQITTARQSFVWNINLYAIYQRTQSESKSQPEQYF